jgi:hypothetical protein
MAKPLKFHQTLNQAPRSVKHGQHRRAGSTAYRNPSDGAGDCARGSDQSGTTWTTVNFTSFNTIAWDLAEPEPTPPTIPYAGIRTGEIIAHRLWWVIEGRLCSLAHRRLWKPDETIHGDTLKPVNGLFGWIGAKAIWGGTYGFLRSEQLAPEINTLMEAFERAIKGGPFLLSFGFQPLYEMRTAVAGTIKMWGDVVEHERGYRAEFAKLNSIDAIYGPGDIEALRATYGIGPLNIQERTAK